VKEQRFGTGQIVDKTFRNVDAEICIRRIVGCKDREQWQETGICVKRSGRK
jgi:hypothetical protein